MRAVDQDGGMSGRIPFHASVTVRRTTGRFTRSIAGFFFFIAVALPFGCANGSGPGDGGATDSSDNGDVARDADDGGVQADGPAARVFVEGTEGYCRTTGIVDRSCAQARDCIGYRVPFEQNCTEEFVANWFDCDFASTAAWPAEPLCSADDFCKHAPRDCVAGECAAYLPDDDCASDSDCAFSDLKCACIAHAAATTLPNLAFGMNCPADPACEAGTQAICVYNHCRLAGPFMDAAISRWCNFMATACGSSADGSDGEDGYSDCIERCQADGYFYSAQYWPMLRSVGLISEDILMTSEGCLQWFMGPAANAWECIHQ